MKHRCTLSITWGLALLSGTLTMEGQYPGTRIVTSHGNENCIELSNETATVVLEPNVGGRVLVYALNGNNVLWINPENEGKPYIPDEPYGHVGAGRFDIGPEKTGPPLPLLFFGSWEGKITGPRQATLISQRDPGTGVRLERRFRLEASGSHLTCTQIIRNEGADTLRHYHWSRTFVEGGGISLTPMNPQSRYPEGYLVYGPGTVMDFEPAPHPHIRVREGILEITGPVDRPKFVMDCSEGWMAYITLDHHLFVKKFRIYQDRPYGDMAAPTASVWYYQSQMCEIEPLGPVEELKPGEAASFTEHWYLHAYRYPADGNPDLERIRTVVRNSD